MKILYTTYLEVTDPGGISKVIREVGINLKKRGHEITVIQLNPKNKSFEEEWHGIKIFRINSKLSKLLYGITPSLSTFFNKKLMEIKPDIIHVHGIHSLFTPQIINLMKKHTVPLIITPHYDFNRHLTLVGKYFWKLYVPIIRKTLERANRVVSVSQFESQKLMKEFAVPKEKISLIPHGVNKIEITKKPKPKKNDIIRLLYVGYLLKIKGVQYIIRALKELRKMNKKVILTIVGEGPYKTKLMNLSQKLGVQELIIWKSNLSDEELYKTYKQADIFLLVSRSEAYGIVAAEALALGIPTIVSKTTALKEFIKENGCFGIDYPPNPKELARLILDVYKSDVEVGPFSKKIRLWEETAIEHEKLYFEALKEGR